MHRFALVVFFCLSTAAIGAEPPNLLVLTVDDMSCDSVGVFGCKLAGTTPNIDRLAASALRFNYAHVQVGNCMPSRNVMFSGRYPHNNHVEGFYMVREPGYQVLADYLKQAGYYTAVRHKVSHSTPYSRYPAWDAILDISPTGKPGDVKRPESYYESTQQGIAAARKAGKPFYLNINVADPHKPFYNEGKRPDPNQPSRVFTADEVPIPGFLFDDPEVREELAQYYSSVRRADDGIGQALRALDEAGLADRTVVVFLSDHGMPLPFAKTQLYYHSTRTPLVVRWPGVTKAGAVDDAHLVSAVDLMPTLLEVVGLDVPAGLDGRSFAPLLRGEKQDGRDMIVTEYNENAGGFRHPMRAVVTHDFGYIFNPWSNGERVMATATKGTITYRRMRALAPSNPEIAARLDLFEHRVPEELYNYAADPDARTNLVRSERHRAEYDRLTTALEAWMVKTADPMLEVFRGRADPQVREAYMAKVEAEAAARRGGRQKVSDDESPSAKPKKQKKKANRKAVGKATASR
ncbi:MAG: sulfatase [Planctomycetaceae bacterium]|nr:sulfatase [Planctomycetaceae bacterium]